MAPDRPDGRSPGRLRRRRAAAVLAGQPARPRRARAAHRHRRGRPVHRRWRLHRTVGGARRQGAGPRPGRRGPRGHPLRRRGQRPQRRVPGGVTDPWPGQRAQPLPRRDRAARTIRRRELRRPARRPGSPRHRVRLRDAGSSHRRARAPRARRPPGGGRAGAPVRPRRAAAGRRRRPRPGQLTHLSRRCVGPDRLGARAPRAPRGRPARRGSAHRRAHPRAQPGPQARRRRLDRGRDPHRGRHRQGAQGPAGHERIPAARQRRGPLHRSGL